MDNLSRSGIKGETFNLTFDKKWKTKYVLSDKIRIIYLTIIRFLKCNPTFDVLISGKMEQLEDGTYKYPVKLSAKHIRLFGIIIKTINYE